MLAITLEKTDSAQRVEFVVGAKASTPFKLCMLFLLYCL